jgi:tyrosyl-tRNA synthetase
MALPDPMIEPLFVYCTRIPLADKESLLNKGPRDAKAGIAFDIVKRFHGAEVAKSAEESFEKTFSKGGLPEDIQEVILKKGESLPEILIKVEVIPSKAEWRRLIDGGAVRLEDDTKITDPNFAPASNTVLKIGKRRFVRVIVQS